MRFSLLICCGVCCIATPAFAQLENSLTADRQSTTTQSEPKAELGSSMTLKEIKSSFAKTHSIASSTPTRHQETLPIDVQPANEPTPALRLRLYPAKWELKPHQALMHFTRAQNQFLQIPAKPRTLWQSHEWLEGTGDDAPSDRDLKSVVEEMQPMFGELHDLAVSEDFRWDHRIRDLRGPAVYMYLLPDVQEVRSLARMLQLKIRYQIQQKDFDGAVSSISDGLRLAEFVGQGETLVQKLVGIAVASVMRDSITKLIATEGSPNLYWALATIPRPLIGVGDSIQWELNNVTQVLPVLADAHLEIWTESKAAKKWSATIKDLASLSGNGAIDESGVRLALAIASAAAVDEAKQRLIDAGFSKQRLDSMPTFQIVLIDAAKELQRVGDDLGKAHLLPTALGGPMAKREQDRFNQWTSTKNQVPSVAAAIGGLLYPAVVHARAAETRTHMTYNRLMTLEALRMHSAQHDGKLPESLDQLSPVPALPDPYTDKPFEYSLKVVNGQTVVRLKATGPTNYKPLQTLSVRFSK